MSHVNPSTTPAGPEPADGAEALRKFVFGDVPLGEWKPQGDGEPLPPWDAFERARQLAHGGEVGPAADIWWQIALSEGIESRQTLQAWHFLREAGRPPPAELAKVVLGTVIEMPVDADHDLLAAYRDGSARYLNPLGQCRHHRGPIDHRDPGCHPTLDRSRRGDRAGDRPLGRLGVPHPRTGTGSRHDAHSERTPLWAGSPGCIVGRSCGRSIHQRRSLPHDADRQPDRYLTIQLIPPQDGVCMETHSSPRWRSKLWTFVWMLDGPSPTGHEAPPRYHFGHEGAAGGRPVRRRPASGRAGPAGVHDTRAAGHQGGACFRRTGQWGHMKPTPVRRSRPRRA